MITREEVIDWANNPVTKGLYELYKAERDKAEDDAFNSSIKSLADNKLTTRTYEEVLQYSRLEVANRNLASVFPPLYDNIEELRKEPKELEESEEEIKEDFINSFINTIKEINKNAK